MHAILVFSAFLIVIALPVPAYVGPGAAVGLIGTALGLGAFAAFALAMIVSWPFYILYKKMRKSRQSVSVSAKTAQNPASSKQDKLP